MCKKQKKGEKRGPENKREGERKTKMLLSLRNKLTDKVN